MSGGGSPGDLTQAHACLGAGPRVPCSLHPTLCALLAAPRPVCTAHHSTADVLDSGPAPWAGLPIAAFLVRILADWPCLPLFRPWQSALRVRL